MRPLLLNAKKRFLLSLLSMGLLFASAVFSYAKAGDVADRAFLGFSPDGAYFAFEEFGVQDGSGFPYANIYIIRTNSNSWVKGSPYRVLLQDETKTLAAARRQAEMAARPALSKYDISRPGKLLAHNPVTELNADRTEVTVAPGAAPFLKNHALTFRVSDFEIATKRCNAYGPEAQMGYMMSVQRAGGAEEQLHKDQRIPTSRGCPKRYAISDIVRFVPEPGAQKALYVVLLQVFSYGFEGDDGRYLATSHWMPSFTATN